MSSFSVVFDIMKLSSVSLLVLCISMPASWMREAFSGGSLRGVRVQMPKLNIYSSLSN